MSLSMRAKATLLTLLLLAWGCGREEKESRAPAVAPQRAVEATPGYQSVSVENGAVISGEVIFKGQRTPRTITVTKDQEVCGQSKADPSLTVSAAGGVQNAVVHIKDIQKGKK